MMYVVDQMMGAGKTSAAINYINSHPDKKFMFIAHYLDEADRIKNSAYQHFSTPEPSPTKTADIKRLIKYGRNIASTHELFKKFDNEVMQLIEANEYTLIIDEVLDVISQYDISPEDICTLQEKYVEVGENGVLKWTDSGYLRGKFEIERNLCELGCLVKQSDSCLLWMLPLKLFSVFKNVFVLTYMFDGSMQKHYYDLNNVDYKYKYVDCIDGIYYFTDIKSNFMVDRNKIHICEHEKLNEIGKGYTDLSKSWYSRNQDRIPELKNNVYNYFRNVVHVPSKYTMWTTFKMYIKNIKGKGYSKGFLSCNTNATNKMRNRFVLAYTVNRYMHTPVANYLYSRGVNVDQDKFALSEMVQWLWRSRIRDGKDIYVYIPSSRMRNLLKTWIEENGE